MRKLLAAALAVVATLLLPLESALAESGPAPAFPQEETGARAMRVVGSEVGTEYHTQEEIVEHLARSGVTKASDCKIQYAEQPQWTNPYVPGVLSARTQNDALTVLNNIRYVAGLDPVVWNEEQARGQQIACIISAANGSISHYPKSPPGMGLTMFKDGYGACAHSNLGAGHEGVYNQILGWMADRQDYNLRTLGHRRWCLNPAMGTMAYGVVDGVDDRYGTYQSMYVHDTSNEEAEQYNVAWPARQMPLEYFGDDNPWSLSIGEVIENPDGVQVVLTRLNDERAWSFSTDLSDGDFHINNDKYGQAGCIIFRPKDVSYSPGDAFHVSITGLEKQIDYDVEFFRAFKVPGDLINAGKPTLTSLVLVVEYVHRDGTLTEEQLELADLNGDGKVTLLDEVLLVRLIRDNM